MLKCKRRRITLEDVEFAHQQILATMLNDGANRQPSANAAAQQSPDLRQQTGQETGPGADARPGAEKPVLAAEATH
jgi:hypothetical protein